jgi:hypothetical protein
MIIPDDLVDLSQPIRLEYFHRRIQVARLPSPASLRSSHLAFAALVGMKMHAPKVTRGIVAFIVSLASLTGLAVGEEGLVRRSVDSHPDLTRLPVYAVCMTPQLMLTAEAVGIV